LRKQEAFDEDRFWTGSAPQPQAATRLSKPATARASSARGRAAAH
jgi:hypothetical protein